MSDVQARLDDARALLVAVQEAHARFAGDFSGHEFHGNQWTEHFPISPHLGLITREKTVDPAYYQTLKSFVAKLPEKFLAGTGKPAISIVTKIPGRKWAATVRVGQYNETRNQITLVTDSSRIKSTFTHELAHAYHAQHPDLVVDELFKKDMELFGSRPADKGLTHYTINPKEAVAQSIAEALGAGDKKDEFAVAFPRTLAHVREYLANDHIRLANPPMVKS
jgi:hypothetical protein